MTWIVGKALPFGYAAAVSDIRVTTPNGHKDCLQKIHEAGTYVTMGFAGSALIGLLMVERSLLGIHGLGHLRGIRPKVSVDVVANRNVTVTVRSSKAHLRQIVDFWAEISSLSWRRDSLTSSE